MEEYNNYKRPDDQYKIQNLLDKVKHDFLYSREDCKAAENNSNEKILINGDEYTIIKRGKSFIMNGQEVTEIQVEIENKKFQTYDRMYTYIDSKTGKEIKSEAYYFHRSIGISFEAISRYGKNQDLYNQYSKNLLNLGIKHTNHKITRIDSIYETEDTTIASIYTVDENDMGASNRELTYIDINTMEIIKNQRELVRSDYIENGC